jgi:hypothetical protein
MTSDGHGLIGAFKYLPNHFATFPRPAESLQLSGLGEALYNRQLRSMRARRIGLRTLYDLVTDEALVESDLLDIRALHREIDAEVFQQFGWKDMVPAYGFDRVAGVPQYLPEEPWRGEVLNRLRLENAAHAATTAQPVTVPPGGQGSL